MPALNVEEGGDQHGRIIMDGVAEISREFDPAVNTEHCDAQDAERFHYIFSQTASHLAQDNGVQRDIGNEGKTLDDFLAHPSAVAAGLKKAHVLALRLYTSNSYYRINGPPTDRLFQKSGRPHPYAATTYYIFDALKKLRQTLAGGTVTIKLGGSGGGAQSWPKTFWRGMADMAVSDEFTAQGGTEMACMSTTEDRAVAEKFAESKAPLLLKLEASSFMACGADISWLSMYPAEKEVLFPPLTYLRVVEQDKKKTSSFFSKRKKEQAAGGVTVIVVEPVLP